MAAWAKRWRAAFAADGWDVDYAWDRHFGLLREAGLPEPPFDPDFDHCYVPEAVFDSALGGPGTVGMCFDAAHGRLRFLPGLLEGLTFVTLVDAGGVQHERSFGLPAVTALIHRGVEGVDWLLSLPPAPPSQAAQEGLLVDLTQKKVRAWTTAPLPRSLGAGWPGWRLERVHWGLEAHLARTGRDPEGWGESALPEDLDPWLDEVPQRRPAGRPAVSWEELDWAQVDAAVLAELGVEG